MVKIPKKIGLVVPQSCKIYDPLLARADEIKVWDNVDYPKKGLAHCLRYNAALATTYFPNGVDRDQYGFGENAD